MLSDPAVTRRNVMFASGSGLLLSAVGQGQNLPAPSPVDTGKVEGGEVEFPAWTARTEPSSGKPENPMPLNERVGFAIVGLGRLSLEEILPAFGSAKKARPVALVSGSPDKAKVVAAQYGIKPESVYSYDSFDSIAGNKEVQAIYVVLPNAMHKEFVLRGAKAGKHVLCEKPMAANSAEAKEMIAGCKSANRLLMIAYRCQYEPFNRKTIALVRSGEYGALRYINAVNTQNMGTGDQWRFKKAQAGGGALYDIGLYCLNATRYLTGEEPIEISAETFSPAGDARYREVEETVLFRLRYPSGVLAQCTASYGMHTSRYMHAHMPGATVNLMDAFSYRGQRLQLSHLNGKVESQDELKIQPVDQFAAELDHMAECILSNKQPHTPGEEGLQDHLLMEAIYRAATDGKPITLPKVNGQDVTRGPMPAPAQG